MFHNAKAQADVTKTANFKKSPPLLIITGEGNSTYRLVFRNSLPV